MNTREYCINAEQRERLHKQLYPDFPIKEDHSPLVSLKESGFNLRYGPSIIKDYKYLVREAVFDKIGRISKILEQDDKVLIIRTAYRSFEHQRLLWENKVAFMQKTHPDRSLEEIKEIVSYYIAPEKLSMHTTGGAVDVLIYDLKNDRVMDFGTNNGLKIDWSDIVPADNDLLKFLLFIDTDSPPTNQAASVGYQTTKWVEVDLLPGTTYRVQILPYDEFGPGFASAIDSAEPIFIPFESIEGELTDRLVMSDSLDTTTVKAFVDQIFKIIMANAAKNVGKRILTEILDEVIVPFKTQGRIVGAEFDYAPTADAEKVVVGLVMKSLANEFFKVMQEATVEWADTEPGIELIPVGMNSETDIDTQFAAVENFVTQDVDLIVVAAADSVGMVAPVKKAVDAGITVVNFDVKLDVEALKEAGLPEDFLFVGPDNAEGAKLAGDALGEVLGEGGKVIIIEGNPGADNATQRKNGFMQSVEEYGLELLDSKTAHWETEEANTVVSNLLVKYPDVQGIMAANDSMALGVVKAIESAGLTGQVLVVGFDNIPAIQDMVKDGTVLATIDQFGPEMAKNAIEIGLQILAGEELGGWIKTPVRLIMAEDLQ